MKYLLLILSISILLSGELEVDGNLKVTGTVESTTIDSLKAVIAELQAQLAALQVDNKLETRIFTLNSLFLEGNHGSCNEPEYQGGGCNSLILDLNEITGINITNAFVSIFKIENINNTAGNGYLYMHDREYPDPYQKIVVECHNGQNPVYGWPDYQTGSYRGSEKITYYLANGPPLKLTYISAGSVTLDLTIAVTAQFPN